MTRSRTVAEITGWAVVVVAGYVIAYQAQRSLFLVGIPAADPYAFPRAVTDPAAASVAVTRYAIGSLIAGVAWIALLIRSRSASWRSVAAWPLALTGAGYLIALVAHPSQSIDVLSYLAHGYLAAVGGNPYLQAAGDVAGYPYGSLLAEQGWSPVHPQTPYGPAWTWVERLAYGLSGGDVVLGVLLLKVVAVAATLLATALIWSVARRLRPGTELTAALAFAWSPVVVVQFGLDAHNDAVAVALVLLAVWAAITGRAWLMVLALGLAGLTKITPLMFGPPLAVLLLRTSTNRLRTAIELTVAAVVVVVIGVLLWRPWWIGTATFDGLRASTTPYPGPAPAGWLAAALTDPLTGEPDPRAPLILAIGLVVVAVTLSWQRRADRVVNVCGAVAVVALALAPAYWPWYAGTAIALLALRTTWVSAVQLVLLSAGAVVTGLLGDLAAIGMVTFEEMFSRNLWWGITVPVAGCAVVALAGLVHRLIRTHDRFVSGVP